MLVGSLAACGGGSSSPATSTPPPTTDCSGSTASIAKAAAKPSAHNAAVTPQASSPLSLAFFGMHIDDGLIANPATLPWPFSGLPQTASGSPFGTIRMHDTETTWNDIDKGNGTYDFTTLDQWRGLYKDNPPQSGSYQIMYTFTETPGYASSDTSNSCTSNNGNTHPAGSCAPPSDVCSDGSGTDAAFTNFVTALATHVNTDSLPAIHNWEIWNEPNITGFWTGTPAQLARMAQDARCVIKGGDNCNSQTTYSAKGIDPTARMHTPAPVTTNDYANTNPSIDSPDGWLTAYFNAGGGKFADVVDFHGYVGGNPIENVVPLVQKVQGVAGTLPLWDSEIGFNPVDVTDPYTQAGWLAKTYLLQGGLGVQTVAWFEFGATNVGELFIPGQASSITPLGTYNTAGLDYAVLSGWLAGATPTGACTSSGTVWTCGFTVSGGAQAEAVWDSSQTCSNSSGPEVCTFSSFSPGPPFTTYSDLQGDPAQPISGNSVPIGIEPVWLQ